MAYKKPGIAYEKPRNNTKPWGRDVYPPPNPLSLANDQTISGFFMKASLKYTSHFQNIIYGQPLI